jgi:hypothetical protein
VERANLVKCKVLNPLWLLAGPKKLPEADILNIIDEGWGNEPVHPLSLNLREDGHRLHHYRVALCQAACG